MRARSRKLGRTFLGSAALIVAWPALGQTAPTGDVPTTASAASASADSGPASEQIVVTGTRLARSGFSTPTPTTVLGADDLNKRGFTNIGQIANAIPAFEATTTPASTTLTSNRAGGAYLNLRGLGDNRTLILVDSRRFVPTNTESSVDTNVIPSALVERVEVVTGGASAAYGSDAVAGVVNIILKKDLEGVLASAQGGVSTHGDNGTYKASLAFGTRLGDRGHFEIAGEGEKNEGIGFQTDRGWSSHNYALVGNPNAATPANIIAPDTQFAIETPGGLVRSGPFRGTQFAPGGAPIPLVGGPGDGFYQIGGNGVGVGDYISLSVPYSRYSAFAKADYDLGGVKAFAEASFSHSEGHANVLPASNFGSIVIQQDNAFLDRGLRAQLLGAGLTSFRISRYSIDFGLLTSNVSNDTTRVVAGLEGGLGGNWKWNAYGQFGDTISTIDRGNTATNALFAKSADAVTGPNGQPVCRVNLAPGDPGVDPACVPVNLFGFGSPSRAALNYFLGTSKFRASIHQYVGAGSVTGDLFQLDGKPVSVAFGVEYRNDKVVGTADPISRANGFTFGNPKSIAGSRDVIEGFGEVAVPLLHDRAFAKSLDLDGAFRVTNYTGSGTVVTWKAGANWALNDSVRLRATRSRDIRAANLSELYQTSNTLFATVRDPANGGANTTVTQVTGGNALLADVLVCFRVHLASTRSACKTSARPSTPSRLTRRPMRRPGGRAGRGRTRYALGCKDGVLHIGDHNDRRAAAWRKPRAAAGSEGNHAAAGAGSAAHGHAHRPSSLRSYFHQGEGREGERPCAHGSGRGGNGRQHRRHPGRQPRHGRTDRRAQQGYVGQSGPYRRPRADGERKRPHDPAFGLFRHERRLGHGRRGRGLGNCVRARGLLYDRQERRNARGIDRTRFHRRRYSADDRRRRHPGWSGSDGRQAIS